MPCEGKLTKGELTPDLKMIVSRYCARKGDSMQIRTTTKPSQEIEFRMLPQGGSQNATAGYAAREGITRVPCPLIAPRELDDGD